MRAQAAKSGWHALESLFSAGSLGALTDIELLDRFRNDPGVDGQQAFCILVERHGPMVQRLCRKLVPDAHEAEDAFQATFLVLVCKGHALGGRESIAPWLYGVARRVACRARRRSIHRQSHQAPLDDVVANAGTTAAFDCDGEEVIYEEIDRLPARLRATIVLCALQGLSYDAAARQLGLTEPALRGRLHRARRRLKSQLHARGIAFGFLPALEPLSQHGRLPAVAPGLIRATVQHATGWSSVSGWVASESAIPPTILALAQGVIRSMFSNAGKAIAIAAVLGACAVSTVVWAQQGPPAIVATIESPRAHPQVPSKIAEGSDQNPGLEKVLPQFRSVVGAHDATLRKIQTLKCGIDFRASTDGGRTWKSLETYKVWKSGPRERIHKTTHHVYSPGGGFEVIMPPGGEKDVLFAPDGVRTLDRYDTANPPKEPVTIQSRNSIVGTIQPSQAFAVEGYKGGLAADYLLLTLPDVIYSLHDLCEAEINAASKPVERRDAQGNVLWDLALKAPPGPPPYDRNRKALDGKYYSYVVTLSPPHGYAIIASERVTRIQGAPGQPVLEIHDRMQVQDFQEPAPGVFLAKKIRRTRARSDTKFDPQYRMEIIIHDVQANGPITEKELAFRFPKGIGVLDSEKDVYHVWGDGAPESTHTIDQYNELRRRQMKEARGIFDR